MRAHAWEAKSDLENSLKDFNLCIGMNPKDPEFFIARGRVLQSYGKSENALKDLTEAIYIDQTSKAYAARGSYWKSQEKYKNAISDFQESSQLGNCNLNVFLDYFLVLNHSLQHEKANKLLDEAIRIDPKSMKAIYYRGIVRFGKDNYEQAIDDFTQVIEFEPEHVNAIGYRGQAFMRLQEYSKAISDFDKADKIERSLEKQYKLESGSLPVNLSATRFSELHNSAIEKLREQQKQKKN